MKITQLTPDETQLEIDSKGARRASLFFMAIALGMMVSTIATLGKGTTVYCQRLEPQQVNCELTPTYLFGLVRQEKRALPKVRAVEVDTLGNGIDDELTNNVYLVSPTGHTYISGNLNQALEIKRFLESPERESMRSRAGLMPLLLAVFLCLLLGLTASVLATVFVSSTEARHYRFNRRAQELIVRRYFLYRQRSEQRFPFSQVQVYERIATDSEGDRYYQVVLELPNTELCILFKSYAQTAAEAKLVQMRSLLAETA